MTRRIMTTALAAAALSTCAIAIAFSAVDNGPRALTDAKRVPIESVSLQVGPGNARAIIHKNGHRITRVVGFDPAVLNVKPLDPQRIRLEALKSGVTILELTNDQGEKERLVVIVKGE